MQRRVKVHAKSHWVTIHQYSDPDRPKEAWYAMGEYLGQDIFTGGSTEEEALKKWVRSAEAIGPQ